MKINIDDRNDGIRYLMGCTRDEVLPSEYIPDEDEDHFYWNRERYYPKGYIVQHPKDSKKRFWECKYPHFARERSLLDMIKQIDEGRGKPSGPWKLLPKSRLEDEEE